MIHYEQTTVRDIKVGDVVHIEEARRRGFLIGKGFCKVIHVQGAGGMSDHREIHYESKQHGKREYVVCRRDAPVTRQFEEVEPPEVVKTGAKLYIATENADLIEGRGPSIVTGIYSVPEDAISAVRGRGVMYGDGQVYEIPFENGRHLGRLMRSEFMYYGYHKQADGTWGHGLTDLAK